jgi:predicted nucleic acid-binding protein
LSAFRVYLLDADILIDVQRGHPPAVAWFASLTDLPSIPGFVVMELLQDARNSQEVGTAMRLVAPFTVIWPTETECNRALSDFTAYHLSHNLGLIDALIAACAVGRNATLCTFNVKHYGPVPGLVTGQPYIR